MKKVFFYSIALFMAVALTSCKTTKDSAYKKAYEKAKAAEQAQPVQQEVATVAPVQTQPVQPQTVDTENVSVRQEDGLTVVSGRGLSNYSVVVGSFSMKANAEGLQQTLKAAGYEAQIAYNAARNMYRVVASTFVDKASAVASRNQFRDKYPDAWLLYQK